METKTKNKKDYRKARKVEHGVSVHVNLLDVINASDKGLIITGTTSTNDIKYYAMPVFIQKYKVSYSTIARNIEKFRYHPDAHNYFLKIDGRNFVSCGIIGGKKKLTKKFENDDYAQWLRCYTWNLEGTVSYSDVNSQLTVRRTMEKLFRKLAQKYSTKPLVFFYVSEKNPNGDGGYHNHFILGYQDELNFSEVKSFIENTLRSDKFGNTANTLVKEHIPAKNFIGYLVKQIHLAKDGFALLSNRLLN